MVNIETAERNLRDVASALSRSGVDWWLTDGTLLGWAREGDFIEGDSDLDLGVLASSWTPRADHELGRSGFQVRRWYGGPGCQFHAVTRDGVYLDLFRFYPKAGGGLYHSCFVDFDWDSYQARRVDFHYPAFGREWVGEWKGTRVRVPGDVDLYLSTKYGDWRTPRLGTDWDHIGDCQNVVQTEEWHPFIDGPGATWTS